MHAAAVPGGPLRGGRGQGHAGLAAVRRREHGARGQNVRARGTRAAPGRRARRHLLRHARQPAVLPGVAGVQVEGGARQNRCVRWSAVVVVQRWSWRRGAIRRATDCCVTHRHRPARPPLPHSLAAKPVISSDAAASMGAASSGAAGGKGAAGSSTAEGGGAGAAPSSSAPQEWHHVYVCRKQA